MTSNWRFVAFFMVSTFALSSSFAPSSIQNSIRRHTVNPKPVKCQRPALPAMLLDQENDFKNIPSALLPSTNSVGSFLLPAFLAFVITFPAMAADFNAKIFSGYYDDPLHPQCRRQIQVNAEGTTFHFSGDSVGLLNNDSVLRGCTPKETKEFGGRQKMAFDGKLSGNKIKADDSSLQGVWEPAGSAQTEFGDVDGIRWNDGNKWIVKKKTAVVKAGEFITFSYIGVSLLAGVNGLRQMAQRKNSESSSN